MNKFNIGDVVVMQRQDSTGGVDRDSVGTVVHILDGGTNDIGVKWDVGTKFINHRGAGHNCTGMCEGFRGWYVWPHDIRHAVVSLENE